MGIKSQKTKKSLKFQFKEHFEEKRWIRLVFDKLLNLT